MDFSILVVRRLEQPINIPIALPHGEGRLSVAPDAGWHALENSPIDAAAPLLNWLAGRQSASEALGHFLRLPYKLEYSYIHECKTVS